MLCEHIASKCTRPVPVFIDWFFKRNLCQNKQKSYIVQLSPLAGQSMSYHHRYRYIFGFRMKWIIPGNICILGVKEITDREKERSWCRERKQNNYPQDFQEYVWVSSRGIWFSFEIWFELLSQVLWVPFKFDSQPQCITRHVRTAHFYTIKNL